MPCKALCCLAVKLKLLVQFPQYMVLQASSPSARQSSSSGAVQQAASPVARQGVSFSVKQSGPSNVSQLSQENLSIHADRHATYSESELAEAETGTAQT